MAKRNRWDSVFNQIRLDRGTDTEAGSVVYPPLPTDSQLDEVELQLGLHLPESYRVFMKRFGSGQIEGLVYLLPITSMGKGRRGQTVLTRTLEYRKIFGRARWHSNHDWLSRLVYFAGHVDNNSEYAWNPSEVTQRTPHECRFYSLVRLQEDNPIATGGTFADFLTWLDADTRSWRERNPEYEPTSGITFRQSALRRKKAPQKREVKSWLAYNRNAVRDLARTIRDEKRIEAFPILADALEEAGCENADLLDSCRKGDPDIDGAWVLRVLLGEK